MSWSPTNRLMQFVVWESSAIDTFKYVHEKGTLVCDVVNEHVTIYVYTLCLGSNTCYPNLKFQILLQ